MSDWRKGCRAAGLSLLDDDAAGRMGRGGVGSGVALLVRVCCEEAGGWKGIAAFDGFGVDVYGITDGDGCTKESQYATPLVRSGITDGPTGDRV